MKSRDPNIESALQHFEQQNKSYLAKEPEGGYSDGQRMYAHRQQVNISSLRTYILMLEDENNNLSQSVKTRYTKLKQEGGKVGDLFHVQPFYDEILESKIRRLIARKAYRLKMLEGQEMDERNIKSRERTTAELQDLTDIHARIGQMINMYWRMGQSTIKSFDRLHTRYKRRIEDIKAKAFFNYEIMLNGFKNEKFWMDKVLSMVNQKKKEKENAKYPDWINQVED